MYELVAVFATLASVLYLRIAYAISYPGGVPRVGKPGVLGYIWAALRFVLGADGLLEEGRTQFSGRPFVIPTLSGPLFVLGPEYINQVRTASDDVFNAAMRADEELQLPYTLDADLMQNTYHLDVLRTDITRAVPSYIPEVLEETILTVEEALSPVGDATSKTVAVFDTMTYMVAQISNRAMLGKGICRDKKFIHAMVRLAETIPLVASVITWSPLFHRPLVYHVLSSIFGGKKDTLKYLNPFIKKYRLDRQSMEETPNTMLEFLIRSSLPTQSDESIAMRVMMLNFASIHTSSIFITQVLFKLALLPTSDLDSIRAEIVDALESEGGWNKAALVNFRMLDSALREVGRFYGLMHFTLLRFALQGCDLHDGSRIPPGHRTAVDVTPVHFNPELYPNPHCCDLFRFSKLRDSESSETKYGFATIDSNYLPFSTGRHACPGRYFAAMVLKIMLAHILLNYDFALLPNKDQPKNITFNGAIIPSPKGQLVFTKRNTH